MAAELLVYAIIAAGLILWLRSILGTKSDDEQNRPKINLELDSSGRVVGFDTLDTVDDKTNLIEELAQNSKGNMSIADRTAEMGLVEIAKIDKEFDINKFLQASQDAFAYIVESFADGDRDTLKDLLSPVVYEAFDGAITAREKAGETMTAEIQSISKAEVVEARLDGRKAYITIRFWAEEMSVTKDQDGEIIAGHPDKPIQMRDVWTFERDIKGRDPRWLVVETREDGEGDTEIIPNTH